MGCKFSIQVDQPRNKTPRTLQRKGCSVQTSKDGVAPAPDEPDAEVQATDEPDKDNEQVPDSHGSSPDQVEVKTLSKQYRRDWKP